jgi:hypothetical protein
VVKQVPSGDLGWVADDTPGPEELAEQYELDVQQWRRLRGNAEPPARMTTGMTPTWTAEIVGYNGVGRCPVCANPPRVPGCCCLVCSATAKNPGRHAMQETPQVAPVVRSGLRGGRG